MSNLVKKTIDILKKHKVVAAASSVIVGLVVAILLLVSGKETATADSGPVVQITAPEVAATPQSTRPKLDEHFAIPIKANDGITVTTQRNIAAVPSGISKNSEVTLTAQQVDFVQKFGQYLGSIGKAAVVTSGERSPENQLGLIKDRIEERDAQDKFPQLEEATLADTKIWLDAWKWLRSRHVPVYAPQQVSGQKVSVSNHLKGMAIDFVGNNADGTQAGNLDQVRAWLTSFTKTTLGKKTALRIVSIAREPGCVHINLAPRA